MQDTHIVGVVGLEIALMRLVKMDHNRHHFTDAQLGCAHTFDRLTLQQVPLPLGFKALAEIIDISEQF